LRTALAVSSQPRQASVYRKSGAEGLALLHIPDVRAGDSFPSSIRNGGFLQPSPAHNVSRTTSWRSGRFRELPWLQSTTISGRVRICGSSWARQCIRNRSSAHRNTRRTIWQLGLPSSGRHHRRPITPGSMLGGRDFIASIATLSNHRVEFLKLSAWEPLASDDGSGFQWFSRYCGNSPSRLCIAV